MDIKIKDEILINKSIIKKWVLDVDDQEVYVEKWWSETLQGDYDNGYAIENEEELRAKIDDEDKWDELTDFINDLK